MSHFRSATCLNVIILKHDKVKVCYFIKSFLSGIILPKLLTYHANFFFKKKSLLMECLFLWLNLFFKVLFHVVFAPKKLQIDVFYMLFDSFDMLI
jgi:hypothetical protein